MAGGQDGAGGWRRAGQGEDDESKEVQDVQDLLEASDVQADD
eukprot:COSAG04_NODE_6337_length_1353_cov_2.255183_3_plen_41_part_01